MPTATTQENRCEHCGTACGPAPVRLDDKPFCCEGCKMVYSLLSGHGLGGYYTYNQRPGQNRRSPMRADKYAFLDDEQVSQRLYAFRNEKECHIAFHLPQIHCSSCLYLLENLRRLDAGVLSSRVDFAGRQAFIVFDPAVTSLRKVAELLALIGYEPYISMADLGVKAPAVDRRRIYQIGVAGFCFGNIMLMSFPEYLGLGPTEALFRNTFRWLSLVLSVPVVAFAAQPFYSSAWKAIRRRYLNIDAPIVMALIITFVRSAYAVLSGAGSGYFDSLAGIVFFMLAGRMLQERTHRRLAFDRDYTAYFPVAVTVTKGASTVTKTLPDITYGDTMLIHSGELVPADGIVTGGAASIDYSFVTGESVPVPKEPGEIIYAGGRQTGGMIEVLAIKEVAQSYLTQLWEREEFRQKDPAEKRNSYTNRLSRFFTYIVFTIAVSAGVYWSLNGPERAWAAVTSVLIIACPCALLLSATFTNGNILRILARNQFYLRHAQVIERMAATNHIIFDKTGTLTEPGQLVPAYEGESLSVAERDAIARLAGQSLHPLSRALSQHLGPVADHQLWAYREVAGKGIEGAVEGLLIRIGSRSFVTGERGAHDGTRLYVSLDGRMKGSFSFANRYREGVRDAIRRMPAGIRLSVLSGDGDEERGRLRELIGQPADLHFNCQPQDKSDRIRLLQSTGEKVMMIGDGLNDAAALRQSDTGIALSDGSCAFTPASDAILEASRLSLLPSFIRLCRTNRRIIEASFIVSLLYNMIGLYFAVRGQLSPLIAAVLMPTSSLTILLLTYGCSNLAARRLRL